MTNKYLTTDWFKTLISLLSFIGVLMGVWVNLSNRVTASEEKINTLLNITQDYKNTPVTLARIEERLESIQRDIKKLEDK